MNSACTQSQLCAATPISSFVQCQVSFRLFPSSVATFVLIESINKVYEKLLDVKVVMIFFFDYPEI